MDGKKKPLADLTSGPPRKSSHTLGMLATTPMARSSETGHLSPEFSSINTLLFLVVDKEEMQRREVLLRERSQNYMFSIDLNLYQRAFS